MWAQFHLPLIKISGPTLSVKMANVILQKGRQRNYY